MPQTGRIPAGKRRTVNLLTKIYNKPFFYHHHTTLCDQSKELTGIILVLNDGTGKKWVNRLILIFMYHLIFAD